jgi:hypothetical protein
VLIAAAILVFWYAAHAVLSRFAGTCTMGDTDRFVAGAMVGIPAAAIAIALLLLSPGRARRRRAVAIASVTPASLVLCLWAPLAVSAGIQGHHLCGPEFDAYLDTTSTWERLIPIAHVAVASALLVVGLRTIRRTSRDTNLGTERDHDMRAGGLSP